MVVEGTWDDVLAVVAYLYNPRATLQMAYEKDVRHRLTLTLPPPLVRSK